MKSEDYQKVKQIFQSALAVAPEERSAFLDECCREELRAEVKSLLDSFESSYLEQPAINQLAEWIIGEGLEIGQAVGHYDILEKIGAGGMGVVYLAEDTNLGRRVAIKFLSEEFSRDHDKLSRFVREAKAASALNHPNILTVYEIGQADGKNYIAAEFIEGRTLREHLWSNEPIPLKFILKIGVQISEALSAAHQAGIIHRDIKPENIMIREDGYAKVLDFGLAKLLEPEKASGPEDATRPQIQTVPGMVMGTVTHMSPEQARGKETDARTDIWSLGVVLYEMLAGRLPFQGETNNHTIVAIFEQEPSPLEDVPDELQRIVRKALTKDRGMRYQTAKDLFIDLKNLRKSLEIQGELERSVDPSRKSDRHSVRENTTRFYAERSTEETKPDGRKKKTIRDTQPTGIRTGFWKAALALLFVAGLASFVWWYSGQRKNMSAGFMKTTGITSWSSGPNELNPSASFSPDAKMVAFGSARSGASEIWVKPAVSGGAIQVTKNGFFNQYPVWSPNGQDLAYFSKRGNKQGIWRTSFTGGEQTEIAGDIYAGVKLRHWAKSGKIYFQDRSDLFTVDDTSGEINRVTDFKTTGLMPRVIEISPDESKVAFSIKENDLWKIKIKRLDAEQSEEIAVSKEQIDNIVWHPDGGQIFFSASVGGAYQIFEVPTSGGGAPVQLSNGDLDFFVEDVSTDGNSILYSSLSESSDLWMVTVEDPQESLLANDTAAEFWADISPDTSSVAYQTVARADRPFSGSINIKPISGSGAVLRISANGFSPAWSGDGKLLAFFRRSETDFEIWCVKPTGDDARKLTSGGIQVSGYTATPYVLVDVNPMNWSPDSDALAYAATRDGKSNIWVATPDGRRDERLTGNEDKNETLCCPAWTPDGKHIVVSSRYHSPEPAGPNTSRLWIYSTENSEKRMIFEEDQKIRFLGIGNGEKDAVITVIPDSIVSTPTPESIYINLVSLETGANSRVNTLPNAYSHNIHLSPDGGSIAYVSRRENMTEVWIVPVSGGGAQKLLTENDPKVFISSLAWAPDGKSIVFGRQTRNYLLSMLVADPSP